MYRAQPLVHCGRQRQPLPRRQQPRQLGRHCDYLRVNSRDVLKEFTAGILMYLLAAALGARCTLCKPIYGVIYLGINGRDCLKNSHTPAAGGGSLCNCYPRPHADHAVLPRVLVLQHVQRGLRRAVSSTSSNKSSNMSTTITTTTVRIATTTSITTRSILRTSFVRVVFLSAAPPAASPMNVSTGRCAPCAARREEKCARQYEQQGSSSSSSTTTRNTTTTTPHLRGVVRAGAAAVAVRLYEAGRPEALHDVAQGGQVP